VAERPIVIYGDPVLREVSTPVSPTDQETVDLVTDLIDSMKKAKGLGLAAVQIGIPKRVFVVDLSAVDASQSPTAFINPEIVETDGLIEIEEGCLSFPGIYQKIVRPARVVMRAYNLKGEQFEIEATGMLGRALLHEFDHLEGKLFIDRMSPLTKTMLRGRLKKLSKAS
jgi:peptide deformylase